VDMEYSLGIEDPGNNTVSLNCVDLQLHSGNILVNGDIPLLSSTDKVHGFVVVSAYDFVEVEELDDTSRGEGGFGHTGK